MPAVGFGNKIPILKPETTDRNEWLLAANLNAMVFDFVTRQKIQGQTLNLFILEQLPVIPNESYDRLFGMRTAREVVRDHVLRLTYTAHDMAPFARDLGYDGPPLPGTRKSAVTSAPALTPSTSTSMGSQERTPPT